MKSGKRYQLKSLQGQWHLYATSKKAQPVVHEASTLPVYIVGANGEKKKVDVDKRAACFVDDMLLKLTSGTLEPDWEASFARFGIDFSDIELAIETEGHCHMKASKNKHFAAALAMLSGKGANNELTMGELQALAKAVASSESVCVGSEALRSLACAEPASEKEKAVLRNRLSLAIPLCSTAVPSFDPSKLRYDALASPYREQLDKASALLALADKPLIVIKGPQHGCPSLEIAKTITCAFGNTFFHVSSSNVSSSLDIAGTSTSYSLARPSIVSEGLCTLGKVPILVSDVDKLDALKKSDGDPIAFLLGAAGKTAAAAIDQYIGVPFRAPTALIVVEGEQKCFSPYADVVIELPKLTRADKIDYAKQRLSSENEHLAEEIVDRYSYDDGTIQLDTALSHIGDKPLTLEQALSRLPLPDVDDPRYWLATTRNRMSASQLTIAEGLLEPAISGDIKAKERLSLLCKCVPQNARLKASYSSVLKAIQKTHPGMPGANALARAVTASVKCEHPRPILLHGPAGTGKTTIVASIAEALSANTGTYANSNAYMPLLKIDCGGLSADELYGTVHTPSMLAEGLACNEGIPCVVLLDEADKKMPLPPTSLLSLLDHGKVKDSYCNCDLNASRNLVILTCNDLDSVNDYVRDRCRVVEVCGYTSTQKAEIAKTKVIPEICKMYGIKKPLVFDEDALLLLCSTDSAGLRETQDSLELVIACHTGNGPITINEVKDVCHISDSKTTKGGANIIMPRTGAKGGACFAKVVAFKSPSDAQLKDGAFTRVVKKASAALHVKSNSYVCSLCDVDQTDGTYAPSAGLGVAVSLALKDLDSLNEVAFVGDANATGEVVSSSEELQRVEFIADRAKVHNIRLILAPPKLAAKLEKEGIASIAINTVDEGIEYARGLIEIDELCNSL